MIPDSGAKRDELENQGFVYATPEQITKAQPLVDKMTTEVGKGLAKNFIKINFFPKGISTHRVYRNLSVDKKPISAVKSEIARSGHERVKEDSEQIKVFIRAHKAK